MTVRRSQKKKRLEGRRAEALFPWSVRTTETTLASGYLNANTCAVFLVPPIIRAIRDAIKRVDSVVVIPHAISHVGNLAPLVWNLVNGGVPTTPVPWCAAW